MSTPPRLALRLWAQQHVSRVIGKGAILLESNELVLCFDARGVAAIVCESPGMQPSTSGLAGSGGTEPWPILQLHRTASGAAQWVSWPLGATSATTLNVPAAQATAKQTRPQLTEAGRKLLVEAIESYYMQHVLEPSVAGFLSILEKTFARADLCTRAEIEATSASARRQLSRRGFELTITDLFELLQNAVDEGARRVKVRIQLSRPSNPLPVQPSRPSNPWP